jgi:antitoxin MazE
MKTTVQKWGNSLGLRIPKAFAEEAAVREGSAVDLSIVDGGLIIRPVPTTTYGLEELLARITKENLHDETTFGAAEGREVW